MIKKPVNEKHTFTAICPSEAHVLTKFALALKRLVRSDTHTNTFSWSTYASNCQNTNTTSTTLEWNSSVSGPSSWTKTSSSSTASRVSATVSSFMTLPSRRQLFRVTSNATRLFPRGCLPTFGWIRSRSKTWALSELRRVLLTSSAVRTLWRR